MLTNSLVVSLAVLSIASPVFSAPLSIRNLRLASLPSGAIGSLIKSLGGGLLSGGAIAGLEALLSGGGDGAAAKRAVEDLSDEQLNTLLEWVNDNKGSLSARGIAKTISPIVQKISKRAVEDLNDEQLNILLEWVNDNKDSMLSTRALSSAPLIKKEISLNELD
ncbi:hypothetical protein C8J57DRAFT_11460 [Mycena rebaudengoi]|nr:hypothetical protein C8J57DRAFT_11460 [Mycena rebaudengoi]